LNFFRRAAEVRLFLPIAKRSPGNGNLRTGIEIHHGDGAFRVIQRQAGEPYLLKIVHSFTERLFIQIKTGVLQIEPAARFRLVQKLVDAGRHILLRLFHPQRVVDHEQRIPRKIVENTGEIPPAEARRIVVLFIKQGQENRIERGRGLLPKRFRKPAAQLARKVQIVGAALDIAHGPVEPFLIEENFAGRTQNKRVHGRARALGRGVKAADGFDLVARHLQTQGVRRAGRKNIQNIAAQAELAGIFHQRYPRISARCELLGELLHQEHIADGKNFQILLKFGVGHDFLHAGRERGDNDLAAVHLQLREHMEAGHFFLPLQGEHVHRKKIEGRVMQHCPFAQEERQISGKRSGFLCRGTQDDQRRGQPLEQQRGQKRTRGGNQTPRIRDRRSLRDPLQQLPHGRGVGNHFFIDNFSHEMSSRRIKPSVRKGPAFCPGLFSRPRSHPGEP